MMIRARAPLRLGLAGGGTDLSPYCDEHGGAVLNATIDYYAYATLRVAPEDDTIRFETRDGKGRVEHRLVDVLTTEDRTLPLHLLVYRRIVRDFLKGKPFGGELLTYCEAPPGSGLGSSSTMVVAMIKAMVEAFSLPLGEYDIAHLAFDVERNDAKMAGGRQDQYAAAFGGFNFIEFLRSDRVIVNPLRVKNWILAELESSTVLYYTGISRVSSDIINQQVSNVTRGGSEAIQAMHRLKEDAFAMKEAILKGSISKVAEILAHSWLSKKMTASGISSPVIESAMDVGLRAGAHAGKVSGAGGGGFITFIADPVRRIELIRALEALPGGRILSCSFSKNGTQGWRVE